MQTGATQGQRCTSVEGATVHSYHIPCLSPIVARSTTPGGVMSTTSKRTLRDYETAKACKTSNSDHYLTGRVVALPSQRESKRLFEHVRISRNDHGTTEVIPN